MALAGKEKAIAIMDESYGNEIAEFYSVESHGSIYLILMLVKDKVISKKDAVRYINEMMGAGFYLSNKKHGEILDKLKRV